MKTYKIVLISLIFTVFPSLSNGQSENSPIPLGIAVQHLMTEKFEGKQHSEKTNEIFIQQIGKHNTVVSNIASTAGALNLNQNGELNTVDLTITAKSYLGNIDQNGEYNNIFENIYAPSSNISLNLSQNGNNNHFERYGSNSIGDKIGFKMNGNDKAIIVRNFK